MEPVIWFVWGFKHICRYLPLSISLCIPNPTAGTAAWESTPGLLFVLEKNLLLQGGDAQKNLWKMQQSGSRWFAQAHRDTGRGRNEDWTPFLWKEEPPFPTKLRNLHPRAVNRDLSWEWGAAGQELCWRSQGRAGNRRMEGLNHE